MSYLKRTERREMILVAAKQLALTEGFSAMTVRRIAQEAQVAVGQVHHHFQSASHLKALTFVTLIEELDAIEKEYAAKSLFQRITLLLGCENIEQVQPYLRLWNEAEVLMEHDVEMKKAYNLAMENWHQSLVNVIEQGIIEKQFTLLASTCSEDIAWRLIALVCGLEGVFKLKLHGLNEETYTRHIEMMLQYELLNNKA